MVRSTIRGAPSLAVNTSAKRGSQSASACFILRQRPRRMRDREGPTTTLRVSTAPAAIRSEEHTSELQSRGHLVCRLLLEKKKMKRGEAPHAGALQPYAQQGSQAKPA